MKGAKFKWRRLLFWCTLFCFDPPILPTIKHVCVNMNHRGKILHIIIEVQNGLIESLVDRSASMSIMAIGIVQKLGIMHLIYGTESYKTTLSTITKALGRITDLLVKVGNVQCNIVFLIVDTYIYDIMLGLDFLMKIGAILDVEKGVIQV